MRDVPFARMKNKTHWLVYLRPTVGANNLKQTLIDVRAEIIIVAASCPDIYATIIHSLTESNIDANCFASPHRFCFSKNPAH